MLRRLALAFVLAFLAALASPAPAADAAPSPASVKFYVVQESFAGQPEFLFEIAQRFLGSGDRNNEIYELNKGRLQPDGLRLTDPEAILPGWVLQLPDDAKGDGVKTGALPTVAPAIAPGQTSSAAPSEALTPAPAAGTNWWAWGVLIADAVLLLACVVVAVRLWRRGTLLPAKPAPDPGSGQAWMETDRYYSVDDPPAPVAAPSRRPALALAGVGAIALAVLVAASFLVLTADEPARTVAAAPTASPPTPSPAGSPRLGPLIGTSDPTLCLAASTTQEGAPLILRTCDGVVTQQWRVNPDGTIRAAKKCMDVAGAVRERGTIVQLAACNGNKAQQFRFDGVRLVSELTGDCVDVRGSRVALGVAVVIETCEAVGERPWKRLP